MDNEKIDKKEKKEKKEKKKKDKKTMKKELDLLERELKPLRKRKFCDEPETLFEQIKILEERYLYSVEEMQKKYNRKIHQKQLQNDKKYHQIIDDHKAVVEEHLRILSIEMDKNMKALENQEEQILITIAKRFNKKSDEMIVAALKIMRCDFLLD